jgi:fatty-acyl-CoA synthase
MARLTPREHFLALGTKRFGSIGRGSPMVIMDVVNQDGTALSAGEKGEIVCRGANLCAGYEGNTEATQSAFRNGWFYLGDIGIKDALIAAIVCRKVLTQSMIVIVLHSQPD